MHKGPIGLTVAASMFGGLILALILTLLVFGGATEPVISGVALLAFALGWALLAWLSDRRTDQPQRWAYVPAIFMGVLGLAHLVFQPSDGVLRAFGWVWPIAAAALAIWIFIQARRSLHDWSRPDPLSGSGGSPAGSLRWRLRDDPRSDGRVRLFDARPADRRR